MCWAERCCYVVPANLGCVLGATFSFILSLFVLAASISFFIMDSKKNLQQSFQDGHLSKTFGLDLNESSIHIILSIAIIVALMWMLFSILLVIGVTQNKPSLVLSYFAFGIFVTINCQLSALLLLLQNSWMLALFFLISSLFHMHVLVVVHTVYELMSTGKDFRFQQRGDDEDLLADCFEGDMSSV